ncbi:MAG TPA: hypothetical protein VMV09_06215 [Candidatus Saccharimonadales bacterium]|nr:hypothetical protein [Candidatus Saccharimonadales bacterium]
MDQLEQEAPQATQESLVSGPPPEFLNPESPRYQPWAEKQISNATKEKRPLAEFLEEFDAKLAVIGQRDSGSWDPQHNERLLAKFSSPGSLPNRRRRRRRPGERSSAQVAGGEARLPVPGPPRAQAGTRPNSASRRRRRRRPRGTRRGPEAGSAP